MNGLAQLILPTKLKKRIGFEQQNPCTYLNKKKILCPTSSPEIQNDIAQMTLKDQNKTNKSQKMGNIIRGKG